MSIKFRLFTYILVFALFSLKAESVPPTGSKVITITTSNNATVELNIKANAANTPIWVETSSGDYTKITAGISWTGTQSYTVSGNILKVHGDVDAFNCSGNGSKIIDLDVSQNTALISLNCRENQLTTLDLSKNIALTKLWCYDNQLTSLNVNGAKALTYISCYNNQLTNLDVSQNTALSELSCENNKLTSLDLSKNTALTKLWCYKNNLTALDLSKNTALSLLNCAENKLTSLDLTHNKALKRLHCNNNQLTELNLVQNSELTQLYSNDNKLTTLDLSENRALIRLWTQNNQLVSLNVANDNNSNFKGFSGKAFDARGNSDLKCIQIDIGFTPPTSGYKKWLKDSTADWRVSCYSNTNDLVSNENIRAYPNPVKNQLILSGLKGGKATNIKIFDVYGKEVINLITKEVETKVDLGKLTSGVYILYLSSGKYQSSIKIIKK